MYRRETVVSSVHLHVQEVDLWNEALLDQNFLFYSYLLYLGSGILGAHWNLLRLQASAGN